MEVQALKERPHVTPWISEYWDAFQILSSSRIVHQGGIGPIPLSEMVAYMDATYLVDVDERLKFIRMMQSLDRVYVTHINSKAKQQSEQRRKASQARKPISRGRR